MMTGSGDLNRWLTVVGFAGGIALGAGAAPAQEWEDCQRALDGLAATTVEAARAAGETAAAQQHLESRRESLRRCLEDPGLWDLRDDGCRSPRREYESARGELEVSVGALEVELGEVAEASRRVESACRSELGPSAADGAARRERLCRLLQSHREQVEPAKVRELCEGALSAAECGECPGTD